MFKEKVEKVIEEIQSKNKDLKLFPSLLEICEPGETNFIPRKINDSGYVLLCPFKVSAKKQIIQGMKPNPTDFMGVSPFMMVVMESGSSYYSPGDIVVIDPRQFEHIDENFIIIKSAVAYLMPDSIIQGIEGDITQMVKEYKLIKTIADA
jgi:hypothetical protein